ACNLLSHHKIWCPYRHDPAPENAANSLSNRRIDLSLNLHQFFESVHESVNAFTLNHVTLPSPRRQTTILIALWAIFYFSFPLFPPPLLDDADSVRAEVAREMVTSGNWTTLYANGIRYLEKAPILYWSMATSFKLFGVHTSTARIPLALMVLALVLITQ